METQLYSHLARRPWHQFHVQQNTTPHRLRLVLERGFASASVEFGATGTRDLIRGFLRGLDVLTENGELTSHGERLRTLNQHRPDLLCEAVHVWLRCHALTDDPPRFALAYDGMCNLMYPLAGTAISTETLLSDTRTYLRGRTGMLDNEIAFSRDSIKGATFWLSGLTPDAVKWDRGDVIPLHRETVSPVAVGWIGGFFANTVPLQAASETGAAFFARLLLAQPSAVTPVLETLQKGAANRSAVSVLAQWHEPAQIGKLTGNQHG